MPAEHPVETPKPKSSALPPLLTSLALLVLLAGVSLSLWRFYFGPRLAERAEGGPRLLLEEKARRDALIAERERLKALLNLPPCEARARLGGEAARQPVGRGGARAASALTRLVRFLGAGGNAGPSR